MAEADPLAAMNFEDLKKYAKRRNFKSTFKTKPALLKYIREAEKDMVRLGNRDPLTSPAVDRVRINDTSGNPEALERLESVLRKIYTTNKLTELEQVQKMVFTQLGIM